MKKRNQTTLILIVLCGIFILPTYNLLPNISNSTIKNQEKENILEEFNNDILNEYGYPSSSQTKGSDFYVKFNMTWTNDYSSGNIFHRFLDLDGDGILEFIRGTSSGDIYLWNGSGYNFWMNIPGNLNDVGDYDGDDVLELLVYNGGNYYLYNISLDDKTYAIETQFIPTITPAWWMRFGDLEHDGKEEITVVDLYGHRRIYSFNGIEFVENASFDGPYDYGDGYHDCVLIDLDGDNRDEVVVTFGYAHTYNGRVYIYDDYLTGFNYIKYFSFERDPFPLLHDDFEDLTGDGRLDLIIGTGTTSVDDHRHIIHYNATAAEYQVFPRFDKQTGGWEDQFGTGFISDTDEHPRYISFYSNIGLHYSNVIYCYIWNGTSFMSNIQIPLGQTIYAPNSNIEVRDLNNDGFDEIIWDGQNAQGKQVTFFVFNKMIINNRWQNNWTDGYRVKWNYRIPISISSGSSTNYEDYQTSTFINKGYVSEGQIRVVNFTGNQLMEVPCYVQDYNSTHYRAWWKITMDVGQTENYYIYSGNQSNSYRTYEMEEVFTKKYDNNPILEYQMDQNNEMAMEFDGSNDYINIDNLKNIIDEERGTFCLWLRIDSFPTSGSEFTFEHYNIGSDDRFYFSINSDKTAYFAFMDGNIYCSNLLTDHWYHFAGRWNSTGYQELFVDGVLVNEADRTTTTFATDDFDFGRSTQLNRYFDGKLDELRFYNRVLSQSEIRSIMKNDYTNTTGLKLHYTIDNKNSSHILDESGNGFHGSINGATEAGTFVYDSSQDDNWQVMNFEESNSEWIYCSASEDTNIAGKSFSLGLWMKREDGQTGTTDNLIAKGNTEGTRRSVHIRVGSDHLLRFRFYNDDLDTNFYINPEEWYHILATFNISDYSQKLYVDGVLVGERIAGGPLLADVDNEGWVIGKSPYDNDRYYDGSMDDIRIYNRVLSSKEISELIKYNKPIADGLVLHYDFEDIIGNIVFDKSGLDNDGMITGSTAIPYEKQHGTMSNASQPSWNNTNPAPHPFDNISTFSNDGYFVFDGMNDYIGVGNLNDTLNYDKDWTISFWFNGNIDGSVLFSGSDGGTGNIQFTITTYYIKISNSADTGADWRVNYYGLKSNNTYHVVITFDKDNGGELNVFINGTLMGTDNTGSLADFYPNYYPIIGGRNESGGYTAFYNGSIDQFTIYQRTLESLEVQSLYERRKFSIIEPNLALGAIELNLVPYLYQNISVGGGFTMITTGDFNGDGYIDFAGYNKDGHTYVYDGNTGLQLWNQSFALNDDSRYGLVATDLDHDGDDEIIISGPNSIGATTGYVRALYGNNGTIIWSENINQDPRTLALGDFDNDGFNDEIVAIGQDTWPYPGIRVLDNDGSEIWNYPGRSSVYIEVADINADGYDDIMSSCGWPDNQQDAINYTGDLLYNQGYNRKHLFSMGDVVGNEMLEFVGCSSEGSLSLQVYNYTGDLVWDANTLSSRVGSVITGNLMGDTKEEIVISTETYICAFEGRTFDLLWNRSMDFRYSSNWWIFLSDLILEDINRDGILEVITVSEDGYLYILNGPTGEILKQIYIGGSASYGCIKYFENDEGWANIVIGTQTGDLICYSFFNEIESDGDLPDDGIVINGDDDGNGGGGGSSDTEEPDLILTVLIIIIITGAVVSMGIVYYYKNLPKITLSPKRKQKSKRRAPIKKRQESRRKIPEAQMEELSNKLMEALKYCRRESKELNMEVLTTDLNVDLETANTMMKLYTKRFKLKNLSFDQFMELDNLSRSVMKFLKNINQHPSIDELMIELKLNIDQAKLILPFIEKMVTKPLQENFEVYSPEELLEIDVLSRKILRLNKETYKEQDLINLSLILDSGIYSIKRALNYISWIEGKINEIYLSELSDADIRVIEEKIKSSARSIKNKDLKLNKYTIIQETEYSLKDAYIMVAIYNTIISKELQILLLPNAQKVRLETLARKIYDHKQNGDISGYNPEQLFTLDLENTSLEEMWFAKLYLETRIINEIKLEEQYPEIERLIQQQKFSKAIETLKELRTTANSFGFVNVVQWAYENLVLCNILIVKKTILELGQKFTRLQLIEISETSGIEDQNLIISTIKEMITKKEIDAAYFESTQSLAFNIQPVGEEIDNLLKSYDDFEKRDIGKK